MKPMSPFLQHRQANMRKMKVKSPEKETATTASEEDQESSLRGVPSVGTRGDQGWGHWGGVRLCQGVMGCGGTSGLTGALAGSSQWEQGPSVCVPPSVGSPDSPEPKQDLHEGCLVPVDAGGQ